MTVPSLRWALNSLHGAPLTVFERGLIRFFVREWKCERTEYKEYLYRLIWLVRWAEKDLFDVWIQNKFSMYASNENSLLCLNAKTFKIP